MPNDDAESSHHASLALSRAEPRITFFKLIPTARPPQRADRAAAGTLPTRAFRYCEAARLGSGFGYYVFPPIDFSLLWDGMKVHWTFAGADGWMPLKAAQFPGFAAAFDGIAPDDIKGFSPPFVTAVQEPGLVQFWSGLIARTAPGWSTLVRPCANLPSGQHVVPYEGVIETDRWFGPLLTNLRILKTDVPVHFTSEMPVFQVQVLPRAALDEAEQNSFVVVDGAQNFTEREWDAFRETVIGPCTDPDRPRGAYAIAVRKRARAGGCPMHALQD
jgi:hypothetical protein